MSLISKIANYTKSLKESEQLLFFNKMNRIHLEETDDLIRRKFRKILAQEYQLERSGTFLKIIRTTEARNTVLLKQNAAIKKCNTHIWITINPQPSVMLLDFLHFMNKIAKKTCFSKFLYVLEQRGTIGDESKSNIGTGMHAHLLVERNLNYKPCKCCDNIRNSAKKFVGNVKNNNQINIHVIGPDFAKDKRDYILGKNKTGEGKDEKQDADIIWRKANNIQPFYGSEKII